MKATPEPASNTDFLAPRYWPTWLGMSLARLLHLLPYRLQIAMGPMLGRLFMLINPYRRLIVKTNLDLCFPQKNDTERQQLYARFVKSLGLSMVEEAASLWAPGRFFDKRGQVQGLEHIKAAQEQGKGVLLLSGHFCSVDFAGRVLLRHHPVCFTYQELRNPLSNHILTNIRRKIAHCIIHRHDIRGFIKALKAGKVVWYAPDQSLARKDSVFAPFFGVQANTLTATTKLAKMTGAAVLPFEIKRRPDASGYTLTIRPALEDFPGDNETADATRFNALLEAQVRENPEQYLWLHRRFKHRPEGEPKLYPQKPRRVKKLQRAQAAKKR
ncbi:MAG: LpxL/LpxP family Kdo(2)-lipid IV(A) lauroyl/palmitoleoyl acyltransferase [Pseudomonadota bacterium]